MLWILNRLNFAQGLGNLVRIRLYCLGCDKCYSDLRISFMTIQESTVCVNFVWLCKRAEMSRKIMMCYSVCRVAVKCLDFHDLTQGEEVPVGLQAMSIRHLQANSYKVILVRGRVWEVDSNGSWYMLCQSIVLDTNVHCFTT